MGGKEDDHEASSYADGNSSISSFKSEVDQDEFTCDMVDNVDMILDTLIGKLIENGLKKSYSNYFLLNILDLDKVKSYKSIGSVES